MNSIKFRDALERVVTTMIEAVLAFLISTSFTDDAFWRGLVVVVVVGAANAIKMLLTLWVPTFTVWWHDMAYRTASTFAVTLAGAYASASWFDITSTAFAEQAAFAAITAALAVLKSIVARLRPATVSPASFALAG